MPASIQATQTLPKHDTGPKIIVEQRRNLPVPVKISIIKSNNRIAPISQPAVVNFFKTARFQRNARSVPQPRSRKYGSPLCRWIRQKRALNQLINEHKKEIKKKEQAEFEQERLDDFIRWESLKQKQSPDDYENKHKSLFQKSFKNTHPKVEKQKKYKPPRPPKPVELEPDLPIKYSSVLEKHQQFYSQPIYKSPHKYESLPVEKKHKAPVIVERYCRGVCISEKPVKVKPTKKSKSVYVKKYNHRETVTDKFVNCFYRSCCQFYCYLTCLIIITCIIICLI